MESTGALKVETELPTQYHWQQETLYLSGDGYFDSLEAAINSAKSNVEVEMYIFAVDQIGDRFVNCLANAAKRGLSVRVIVDAIGSLGWLSHYEKRLQEAQVAVQVYHPLPLLNWFTKIKSISRRGFWPLASRINRRTHRKLILIDNQSAFVGSRNLTNVHSEALMQQNAWSDLSVCVQGPALEDLQRAFQYSWLRRHNRFLKRVKRLRFLQNYPLTVRLNTTGKLRKWHRLNLLKRFATAKQRIWITTGYFVPHRSLVQSLRRAAKRGVEVNILVPSKSDVFFYPFVGAAFQYELMRAGAKIMEYLPSILHTKAMIIDDYAIVGSSNINHRSLLYDLEVDVVLSHNSTIAQLEERFSSDMEKSRQLSPYKSNYSLWQRLIGQVALLFKRYI